jgi:Family of unknown function (DUF6178)
LSKTLTTLEKGSLRNIVDNPALPAVLRHMQPNTLARLVDRVGLNDAAELMALVPARNLLRALDEAVWKSPHPGANQEFDPAEFIRWLEVWTEIGESFVAERLAAFNDEYLAMCLSFVLFAGAGSNAGFNGDTSETATDDRAQELESIEMPSEYCAIYDHFLVRPAFEDDWEIIRAALDALWHHTPDHLLYILGTLTSTESMLESGGRRTSLNLDLAFERESYRERRGHVSPAGARAFLVSISVGTVQDLMLMYAYDNETRRFLAGIENYETDPHPIDELVASAGTDRARRQAHDETNVLESAMPSQDQIHALSELLENQSLVEPKRFESLPSNQREQKKLFLGELLGRLEGENKEAFQKSSRELAYLATVLMAGSPLEGQPLTGVEARDAALATCNLGLEYLQSRHFEFGLDKEPGLIRIFAIGWKWLDALRDRVIESMRASLIDLEAAQPLKNSAWLRNEALIGIRDLQKAVERREFADVRDAITFLSIVFEAAACREIAPLLDHLPHFAPLISGSMNKSQPRWIESIADLERVSSLLSNLTEVADP